MKGLQLFLAWVFAVWHLPVFASPFDDLGSPSPDVRAHAADLIRQNHLYKSTSRAPWDELVKSFSQYESKSDFLRSVQQKGAGLLLTKQNLFSFYPVKLRLDESWVLIYRFSDSGLAEWRLIEDPKEIPVSPPAGYTGTWHVYCIDGRSNSSLYIDGKQAFLQ